MKKSRGGTPMADPQRGSPNRPLGNDPDEWRRWAGDLRRILAEMQDDLEELDTLAQGLEDKDLAALERNSGFGWTCHMGPWDQHRLTELLERFDPKVYDGFVAALKAVRE